MNYTLLFDHTKARNLLEKVCRNQGGRLSASLAELLLWRVKKKRLISIQFYLFCKLGFYF